MLRALVASSAFWILTAAASPDVVRPPSLDSRVSTLPNGLQTVYLEDHSTPIVHVAVWYHVGSKDERPGRTGFAHLFEHLMFKGSKNVAPEQHPSIITSLGGQSNAYTDADTTVYWETVPSQYLSLVLWLEADRMASLDVSESKFRTELDVVKEERRMRFENPPFGLLSEIIFDKAFTTHPYKHQTIGSLVDLDRASIQDVRTFHDTYYVPNNATLAIAGDFDAAQAEALVTQYLGRVPRGKPVPREIPAEPAHTAAERYSVTEPWPLAAVVVSHHIPADGQPDAYAIQLLARILTDGATSRLYRSLVYEKQVAVAAFGEAKIAEQPGLFYAVAIVQPPNRPEDVLAALQADIDFVAASGVTADELARAKRQVARDVIFGRETVRDKALQIAHAAVIHHDVAAADREFDLFQGVTMADVQRVARTWFAPGSRMVLTVLRAPAGGESR